MGFRMVVFDGWINCRLHVRRKGDEAYRLVEDLIAEGVVMCNDPVLRFNLRRGFRISTIHIRGDVFEDTVERLSFVGVVTKKCLPSNPKHIQRTVALRCLVSV